MLLAVSLAKLDVADSVEESAKSPGEARNLEEVPADIAESKRWRKEIDEIRLSPAPLADRNAYLLLVISEIDVASRKSSAREIAIAKLSRASETADGSDREILLTEAVMWLGMDLKAINEERPGSAPNPYPESRNPNSARIEPTADGVLASHPVHGVNVAMQTPHRTGCGSIQDVSGKTQGGLL